MRALLAILAVVKPTAAGSPYETASTHSTAKTSLHRHHCDCCLVRELGVCGCCQHTDNRTHHHNHTFAASGSLAEPWRVALRMTLERSIPPDVTYAPDDHFASIDSPFLRADAPTSEQGRRYFQDGAAECLARAHGDAKIDAQRLLRRRFRDLAKRSPKQNYASKLVAALNAARVTALFGGDSTNVPLPVELHNFGASNTRVQLLPGLGHCPGCCSTQCPGAVDFAQLAANFRAAVADQVGFRSAPSEPCRPDRRRRTCSASRSRNPSET